MCRWTMCVWWRTNSECLFEKKTWTKRWKTKAFVIKAGKMAFGHATNIIGWQALFSLTKNAKKLTSLIIGRIMIGRRHGTFIYFWISCYCSRTKKSHRFEIIWQSVIVNLFVSSRQILYFHSKLFFLYNDWSIFT